MLCVTYSNQEAKQKVRELNVPDTPVYLWLISHGDVRAIFYKGAFALLQKITIGWLLSYMYTDPEQRGQGHMTFLLKEIAKHYRLFAVPSHSDAEDLLQKCGFVPETHYFGRPYYQSR